MSTTRGACVRIRRARPDDVRRIHEVEAASYATPWTQTFGSLVTRRGVLVLVAELEQDGDARVMGHGVLWRVADEAELANLAVLPEVRGRGIGGALLDRLLSRARRGGVWPSFSRSGIRMSWPSTFTGRGAFDRWGCGGSTTSAPVKTHASSGST